MNTITTVDLLGDEHLTDGIHITFFGISTENIPYSGYGVCVYHNYVLGTNKWCNATAYGTSGNVYHAFKVNASNWSAWRKLPTTAEMNALESRVSALENS